MSQNGQTHICCKIFKMRLTILGHYTLKGYNKNQLKFCRKSYWKKQPFIFTVYLMNHAF